MHETPRCGYQDLHYLSSTYHVLGAVLGARSTVGKQINLGSCPREILASGLPSYHRIE